MIKEIADNLVKDLKRYGITIQRYDAYSTNSVYLKLDYGMCHTIRISDHKGKKHLSYRYNVIVGNENEYYRAVSRDGGWPMHYFNEAGLNKLIDMIYEYREGKLKQYGPSVYSQFMDHSLQANNNSKGFWQKAKLV